MIECTDLGDEDAELGRKSPKDGLDIRIVNGDYSEFFPNNGESKAKRK